MTRILGERQRGLPRWQAATLVFLAAVIGFGAILAITYWLLRDPIWVLHRRWVMADSPYDYDEIHPRFREVDASALIDVHSPETANAMRKHLHETVFGGDIEPAEISITTDVREDPFSGMDAVARIDRYEIVMEHGFIAVPLLLHAREPSGGLVLYHHGYAGTIHDKAHVIEAFLDAGHDVLAFDLMGYGETVGKTGVTLADGSTRVVNLHIDLDAFERPLSFHLQPVIAGLERTLADGYYRDVAMTGFSAGGWTTAVAAALDPRIRLSYPIAGVYPMYLREEGNELAPRPQLWPPLAEDFGYLNQFVLATTGETQAGPRRQLQVFNRYDRCCFRNTKARLYEEAVANAARQSGDGSFGVLIDDSHAEHKVSDRTIDAILADLEDHGFPTR